MPAETKGSSGPSAMDKRSLHSPAHSAPSIREALVVGVLLSTCALAMTSFDRAGGRSETPSSAACGIERVPAATALAWRRPPKVPLILAPFRENADFSRKTAKEVLLRDFGTSRVSLTSSNSYSEHELSTSLREYVTVHVPRHGAKSATANESFYLFGPMVDDKLAALVESYQFPLCGGLWCARDAFAASFGLAGTRSGVSFHTHGSGFGEVLHGRKRWILYPPSSEAPPGFDKDRSTADWVETVLPTVSQKPTYDCILKANELLYFPPQWWHATLNLDEHTVFVSSFASDNAGRGGDEDTAAWGF